MKKHVFLIMSIFCFLTIRILGQSQVGNYYFQSSIMAYDEITGGLLLGSENNDDQRFVDPANLAGGTITTGPGFPIGFGFVFAGEEFDRVAINTNGWISLGKSSLTPSVNNSSSSAYLPIGSTTAITPPELVSRIVAIGRDLQGQTGATLRIQTVGVSPNRECVIQWKGYKKYGTAGTGDNYNFQIRLVETSNQVKLVYGLMNNNATSTTVQVGLRAKPATEVTNYHNRETTSNWSSTTKGATPTASCTLSSSVYPANGLCFLFTPGQGVPGCANNVAPLNGSNEVPISANLVWSSGAGGDPIGYKLFFGTDYPPTNIVNGTDLGNVTIYDPVTDLQYDMPYYWKIVPYNTFGDAAGCEIWSFITTEQTITQLPYFQGFEQIYFPPAEWLNFKIEGTGNPGTWDRQTVGTNPPCLPHTGAGMARYNSFSYQNGTKGALVTRSIDVGIRNCEVSFWMYRDPGFTNDPDHVNIHHNIAPDLIGATLLGTIHREINRDPIVLVEGWYQYSFSFQTLPGNNYLIFEGVSDYGNNMFIDDIEITSPVSVVIDAGNDAYTVAEGSIGFGTDRGYPAIPSGFFGPGSDPFVRNIKLKGQASNGSQLPSPDMMVNRSFSVEFNAIPGEVVIGTEMLQLNLVSKDPIKVTKGGGTVDSFFDVFFQIDIPQLGNMDISLEHETGGTFTMNFSVFPKITFRNTIDPSEEYVLDPLGMGYPPLEYNSQPYGWTTSPIPGDFDPLGYEILHMPDGGACCYLSVLPLLQRMDHTFLDMSEEGVPIFAQGTGYDGGTYYYYPNTEWWNVWLYDHPYTPLRRKIVNGMLQIMPRNPQMPTTITIVYNWSTPNWPGFPVIQRPPLPYDVMDPMMEEMMINRSEPVFFFPPGQLNEPVIIPLSFEYPYYNPEWLSLDVRGSNFILIADIIHTCWDEWEGGIMKEYGDAPEGDMAYIGGAIGQFPTCMNVLPNGFISHNCPNPLFFGGTIDCEGEGNAGSCPMFNPNTYNMDECGTFPYPVPPPPQIDEGLMFPTPLTITGPVGAEQYLPCGPMATSLGSTCFLAWWGQNIDIWINAGQAVGGFINVLFDWNHDGVWWGASGCTVFNPNDYVPEHVLQNFPIPAGYVGPLSGVPGLPPSFQIGPDPGPVWTRFSLTEQPVLIPWDGSGIFADGETEDYLLDVTTPLLDFGDAPAPFPTLLANNGACHDNIGPNIWLGNLKDFEMDGFPDPLAMGDDNNNLADEDGVVLNSLLNPGQPANILVTCNFQNALLHAWIDFNNDGDWLDAGEQIFADYTLNAGPNPLTFLVPATANLGPAIARFRVNTQLGTQFFGYSLNGEVEDYHWLIEPAAPDMDFGDAPDGPFKTLFASDGARHLVIPGVMLGNQIDAEYDGFPSALADGDDLNNLPDEDGVAFMWPVAAGNPCKLKVRASVGNALFNGWIDFNRNGSWDDPGEHVFVDLNLQAGDNYLTFIAPNAPATVPGPACARFRFSHQPALTHYGPAFDGEVEDYLVTIEEYGNIKWGQLPDPNLYGLHSDATSIIADDWICAGGAVTDIHWWGNYEMMGMIEKRGAGINHFLIHFYNNAGCLPANVVATWIVPFPTIIEQFTGMLNPECAKIYKYEFLLTEYFYQVLGNTYWISIQAIPNDINNPAVWRWHESNRWYWPINCGAATMSGMGWQTIIWDLSMPPKFSDMAFEITSQIPAERIIQNVTVYNGEIRCYDATQTIVTAGSGTTFIVQNGAVVYLIAGQNIIMLPGTHFMNGSYVHAYIDLTGEYCRNPKALVSINEEEAQSKEVPGASWIKENFFKVYPNPTTGQFTLELNDVAEFSTIKVEIFSLVGENIFIAELPAIRQYLLDLSAKQPGIYLIRVLQGGDVGVVKLIKQ